MNLTVAYHGGTRYDITSGRHRVVTDQPEEDGGHDAGMSMPLSQSGTDAEQIHKTTAVRIVNIRAAASPQHYRQLMIAPGLINTKVHDLCVHYSIAGGKRRVSLVTQFRNHAV